MAWDYKPQVPSSVKTLASFTLWWGNEQNNVRNKWNQYFDPKMQGLSDKRASYSAWQDAWTGMKWSGSPWEARTQQQQSGMDDLAAQIRGWDPKSSQNMADAQAYAAGFAGMTPSAWTSLLENWNRRFTEEGYAAQQDAQNALTYEQTIANSDFAKEQEQANRVMLRQMEEDVGKRLEAVFGERGGMGGFQAAYELTSELQNTWLQTQSQQHLAMFNQAVAAVNANNGYFQNLIEQGQITGKEYLQFRYGQLQDGFDNYVTSMAQTRADFDLQYQLSEDERQRIDANFASQIEYLEREMYREMGGYKNVEEYLNALSVTLIQPYLAQYQLEKDAKETVANTAQKALGGISILFGVCLLFTPFSAAGVAVIGAGTTALLS